MSSRGKTFCNNILLQRARRGFYTFWLINYQKNSAYGADVQVSNFYDSENPTDWSLHTRLSAKTRRRTTMPASLAVWEVSMVSSILVNKPRSSRCIWRMEISQGKSAKSPHCGFSCDKHRPQTTCLLTKK